MMQDFSANLATDPIAWLVFLGITGMIVWKLIGPVRSNLRLVVQIAFFLAMTAVIVFGQVPLGQSSGAPANDDRTLVVILGQMLWWLHLAWAVIGFVRIYLVLEGRPREARLLQDIVVGGVYLCVALSALAFVFRLPVGTLIATSGVIAIALGLALQNTLGDVFSGIALTLGRTFTLGDWIRLNDGVEGRVVASTWRSTQILTIANNVVVLPNSALAKLGLTNVSRPEETHLLQLTIRLKPTRTPSAIEEVITTALEGCNLIIRNPGPVVALKGIDANAIDADLYARVKDPMHMIGARNEIIDLLHRHCKAANLQLAPSASSLLLAEQSTTPDSSHYRERRLVEILRQNSIFGNLDEASQEHLADAATLRAYPEGDTIAPDDSQVSSVIVIDSGVVAVMQDGLEQRRLSPGDLYGGADFSSQFWRNGSLKAVSAVKIWEIGHEPLSNLLRNQPELARELSIKLSMHEENARHAINPNVRNDHTSHALLRSIRTIFTN